MFIARPDELRSALRFLDAGCSVSIVGPEGSGRSMLLTAIAEVLDARGFETPRITGLRTIDSRPYESLEFSGIASRIPGAGVGRFVRDLAERASSTRMVLLVDDAHQVDLHTWNVIAAVHARTRVPIVAASGSQDVDPGDGASVHAIANQVADIRLSPLSYDAVSDLVHDLLGGPVDTAVVSRIYTKSAGLPSLVSAMVAVAKGFELIAPVDDVWTAVGDLWHESLAGATEHLFTRLGAHDREALELLALAGAIDVEVATDLVGAECLESLERSELILAIHPFGRSSVTVTPPLLSEYFQHRPASLRRARLLRRLENQFRTSEAPAPRPAAADPSSGPVIREREHDAAETAFLRLIEEQRSARLAALGHTWEYDRSPATAIAYLDVLLDGQADGSLVEEVFAGTDVTAGDDDARTEFAWRRARWLAFRLNDLDGATALLRESGAASTDAGDLQRCRSAYLEIMCSRLPEQPLTLPDRPVRTPAADAAALVRAFGFIVGGKPVTALRELGGLREDTTIGAPDLTVPLLRAWARLAAGDVTGAYGDAQRMRQECRSELNVHGLRDTTFLAAIAVSYLGRYREAESLLGSLLSLGAPGLGEQHVYLGALCLASLFAARAGRASATRSLAQLAAAAGVTIGPLPAMTAEIPWAMVAILDGDPEQASRTLRAQVEELRRRGYRFAAAATVLYSFQGVSDSIVSEAGSELVSEHEGTLFGPLRDLEVALRAKDAARLDELAEWFEREGRLGQATSALDGALQLYEETEDLVRAETARSRLAKVVTRRGPGDVSVQYWRATSRTQLSARETEVARYAAHGLTNQEIASRLGVSTRTVESHILKAFRKLGLTSRAELAELDWL